MVLNTCESDAYDSSKCFFRNPDLICFTLFFSLIFSILSVEIFFQIQIVVLCRSFCRLLGDENGWEMLQNFSAKFKDVSENGKCGIIFARK